MTELTNNKSTGIIGKLDNLARMPGRRILIWLFMASLVVRVVFCIISPNPYQGEIKGEIISDAVEYDILARTIVEGGGFGFYPGQPTAFRNPLLPFLAAGVYKLTGPNPVAVQILMIILGSLIPPVLFVLARWFVEPKTALLAAMMAVFYPQLVMFSASLMTETPFALLFLLTLLFWNRFSTINRGGWGLIVWGGIFAGLALLTRTTLGPLLAVWGLYLLIDGGRQRWRYLLRYGVFCGVALLTILPWTTPCRRTVLSTAVRMSRRNYSAYILLPREGLTPAKARWMYCDLTWLKPYGGTYSGWVPIKPITLTALRE